MVALSSSQKKTAFAVILLALIAVGVMVSGRGGFSGLRSDAFNNPSFVCSEATQAADKDKYDRAGADIQKFSAEKAGLQTKIQGWNADIRKNEAQIKKLEKEEIAAEKKERALEIAVKKQCTPRVLATCAAKKQELQDVRQEIKQIRNSLVSERNQNKNIRTNIHNAESNIKLLEKQIQEIQNFKEDYETCQKELQIAQGVWYSDDVWNCNPENQLVRKMQCVLSPNGLVLDDSKCGEEKPEYIISTCEGEPSLRHTTRPFSELENDLCITYPKLCQVKKDKATIFSTISPSLEIGSVTEKKGLHVMEFSSSILAMNDEDVYLESLQYTIENYDPSMIEFSNFRLYDGITTADTMTYYQCSQKYESSFKKLNIECKLVKDTDNGYKISQNEWQAIYLLGTVKKTKTSGQVMKLQFVGGTYNNGQKVWDDLSQPVNFQSYSEQDFCKKYPEWCVGSVTVVSPNGGEYQEKYNIGQKISIFWNSSFIDEIKLYLVGDCTNCTKQIAGPINIQGKNSYEWLVDTNGMTSATNGYKIKIVGTNSQYPGETVEDISDDYFIIKSTLVCGNGIKEGEEQCDDGNTSNDDSCDNQCRNSLPLIPGEVRPILQGPYTATEAAQKLADMGVIGNHSGNPANYKLDQAINKQEFLGTMLSILGLIPQRPLSEYVCKNTFSDTQEPWVCRVAEIAYENGIIGLNDYGTFRGNGNLTNFEVTTLSLRAIGCALPKNTSITQSKLIEMGERWGIVNLDANKARQATRGDAYITFATFLDYFEKNAAEDPYYFYANSIPSCQQRIEDAGSEKPDICNILGTC